MYSSFRTSFILVVTHLKNIFSRKELPEFLSEKVNDFNVNKI